MNPIELRVFLPSWRLDRARSIFSHTTATGGAVMARTPKPKPTDASAAEVLRRPAEVEYAAELEALRASDRDPRPEG
jgi:hypothetical protein